MSNLNTIIQEGKLTVDNNGIYVNKLLKDSSDDKDIAISKKAWTKIYDFSLEKLKNDREDFNQSKLQDAIRCIEKAYTINQDSIYLEIGCGPAHIADYVMETYNAYFVGIDFNYEMLVTLKHYFDEKGYTKYILIYDDINNMPLKDNSIDFIYGGGVIEHFKDTNNILKESYRVLRPGGVSFNTIPAFNLWWVFRFFNNIPDIPVIRQALEYIHINILKGKVLERYYGYELSYTPYKLKKLHKNNQFNNIVVSSFAFYPSEKKMKNNFLRKIYYILQNNILTGAVYMVYGKK
jgi:ubiquinone/menaquinone biosynthesis C-methylase UbiE